MRFSRRLLERIKPRLLMGFDVDEETGCWVWMHNISRPDISPRIQVNGHYFGAGLEKRTRLGVRDLLWEMILGEKGPDEKIGVICNNPLCVNPGHFYIMVYNSREVWGPEREEIKRKALEEFGYLVDIYFTTGCWIMPMERYRYGAQLCGANNKARLAWTLFRGDIPKNARVVPMCDTIDCANPMHLDLRYNKTDIGVDYDKYGDGA